MQATRLVKDTILSKISTMSLYITSYNFIKHLQTLKDVCSLLPNTHLPTLLVSVVTIVLLIAAKELNSFLSSKLPVPIPVELITVS